MAYASLADLQALLSESELVQLSDDEGLAVNQAQIDAAILRADQRIDAYLANLAPVPLTLVPPLVAQYSAKLAVCELYLRRSSASLPEAWAKEQASIYTHLRELAKGIGRLDGLAAQGEPARRPASARSAALSLPSYPTDLELY